MTERCAGMTSIASQVECALAPSPARATTSVPIRTRLEVVLPRASRAASRMQTAIAVRCAWARADTTRAAARLSPGTSASPTRTARLARARVPKYADAWRTAPRSPGPAASGWRRTFSDRNQRGLANRRRTASVRQSGQRVPQSPSVDTRRTASHGQSKSGQLGAVSRNWLVSVLIWRPCANLRGNPRGLGTRHHSRSCRPRRLSARILGRRLSLCLLRVRAHRGTLRDRTKRRIRRLDRSRQRRRARWWLVRHARCLWR